MPTLELTVDEGQVASAARFFRAGHELLNLLDELSEVPQDWTIENLKRASAVVYVGAPDTDPASTDTLREAYSGLRLVSVGMNIPAGWSPDAVHAARRFSSVGTTEDAAAVGIPPKLRLVDDDFESELGSAITLDNDLTSRLAVLQPLERSMPGVVRGRLVGFNVSRGNRASLRLASGRIVRLRFANDLREVFKEAMLTDVEVSGIVKQDDDGRPFHVAADRVVPLPTSTLRWVDMLGSDLTLTDGLSAREYLEENRGEG